MHKGKCTSTAQLAYYNSFINALCCSFHTCYLRLKQNLGTEIISFVFNSYAEVDLVYLISRWMNIITGLLLFNWWAKWSVLFSMWIKCNQKLLLCLQVSTFDSKITIIPSHISPVLSHLIMECPTTFYCTNGMTKLISTKRSNLTSL